MTAVPMWPTQLLSCVFQMKLWCFWWGVTNSSQRGRRPYFQKCFSFLDGIVRNAKTVRQITKQRPERKRKTSRENPGKHGAKRVELHAILYFHQLRNAVSIFTHPQAHSAQEGTLSVSHWPTSRPASFRSDGYWNQDWWTGLIFTLVRAEISHSSLFCEGMWAAISFTIPVQIPPFFP